MKKLFLFTILCLGINRLAIANDSFTISDVFGLFQFIWVAIKFWFALPGILIVTLFNDTSLGHFFELWRYAENISVIVNLVYWFAGFVFTLSCMEYLDKLSKSTKIIIIQKISSSLIFVWFFLPAFVGAFFHYFNPQLLYY